MKAKTCKAPGAVMTIAGLLLAAHAAIAAGDPDEGRELGFTCMGCHGIEGYRNAYPSFRVPRLGGQGRAYIEAALHAYRDGTRPHPTMRAQAGSLSDEDIDNLVAWIAAGERARDLVTTEAAAQVPAAAPCVACHGAEGEGVVPQPPTLSGQHIDYLAYALRQYRDGKRSGTVMSAFATALSDADIEILAKYYGSQQGLQTLEK